MKLTFVTLTAIGALSLANAAFSQQAEDAGQDKRGGRGFRHNPLEHSTERLDLTPQQKTQIQPIIDQASPQLETIRREAMEKTKAVMDNAMAQIRPLLTPEQQKKLDEAQNDRRGGREKRHGRGHHGDHGQGTEDDQSNDNG